MTALQQLRDILDNNRNWSADFIFDTIDELIEKEKEQIIMAYSQGALDSYKCDYKLEIDYYNETFNKNK